VCVEVVQERDVNVLASRCVDVEDAVVAVGGLAGEVEVVSSTLAVEVHVQRLHEYVPDGVVGVPDEHVHGVGVGGAIRGVEDVPFEPSGSSRVTAMPPCAHQEEAPSGRLAFVATTTSPLMSGGKCAGEAGDAGADDEHVSRFWRNSGRS